MRKIAVLFMLLIPVVVITAQDVKWYSIEEAVELNKKEPRKFMIDVYTDWCGWCKVMDKNTFNNSQIAEYLNKKYYPVKLNAEQKEDITIEGQTYKFIAQGSKGYHELAAALLNGKLAYPSVVFLDEKINMLHMEQGYVQPKQFDQLVKFIGEDLYKTTTWQSFLASYKSPFAN